MVERYSGVLRERGVHLERLESIAEKLAQVLRPGDVVLLYGPLGAGKTTFVRAVARHLGVLDGVRSPSFTIANIYSGPVVVQHLDLYRIDDIGDEDALALEEYGRDDAVTFVEWPEAGAGRLPAPAWVVTFAHETLETREVCVEASSPGAAGRWAHAQGTSSARDDRAGA